MKIRTANLANGEATKNDLTNFSFTFFRFGKTEKQISCFVTRGIYTVHIRLLRVGPLVDPERVPKSRGFFFGGIVL